MKFLVLALCVCAASAASFEYKPYKSYQPQQQQYQGFRSPVSAPVAAARATYNTAKFVAPAPVAAAKFVATPFVAAPPVVTEVPVADVKSVYKVPQEVDITPIEPKPFEAVQIVSAAPVVASRTAYETARVVGIAPKTVYNTGKESEAAIVRSDSDVSAEGYNYVYETANGIAAQSSGVLKNVEGANVLVSQGSYQYIAADGTPVKVDYVADENGFQPRSDILPVAPAVPEAILRSLEYIRAHPPKIETYQN